MTVRKKIALTSWVFAALAVLTVPWAIYLASSLPRRQVSAHYDLAWAGFDVGLVMVLALCAVSAWKAHRFLPLAATCAATMLVVDAWFDVVTTPDADELIIAIVMAAVVELPLAAMCLWLALNVQRVVAAAEARQGRRRPPR